MDVEDAVRKRGDQRLADEAHESGEADKTRIACLQFLDERAVIVVARRICAVRKRDRFDARRPRALQPRRIGTIGDDDGDRGVQPPRFNGVDKGLEVGSPA